MHCSNIALGLNSSRVQNIFGLVLRSWPARIERSLGRPPRAERVLSALTLEHLFQIWLNAMLRCHGYSFYTMNKSDVRFSDKSNKKISLIDIHQIGLPTHRAARKSLKLQITCVSLPVFFEGAPWTFDTRLRGLPCRHPLLSNPPSPLHRNLHRWPQYHTVRTEMNRQGGVHSNSRIGFC
jgi:hypothetical protein